MATHKGQLVQVTATLEPELNDEVMKLVGPGRSFSAVLRLLVRRGLDKPLDPLEEDLLRKARAEPPAETATT